MERKLWMNLMVAMLVAGLFLTVSCAQKTVVSEPTTIEDKAKADAAAKAAAQAAQAEQDRIRAQQLEEQAKVAAAESRFVNQNIHFEFDSSELSSMAKMLLKEKAAWLAANPSVSVTIEGHCDDRGTTVYNLGLGERRAIAARNYLADLGIADSRLSKVSFGEEKPLDMGTSEEAYRKNRRAQFVIK